MIGAKKWNTFGAYSKLKSMIVKISNLWTQRTLIKCVPSTSDCFFFFCCCCSCKKNCHRENIVLHFFCHFLSAYKSNCRLRGKNLNISKKKSRSFYVRGDAWSDKLEYYFQRRYKWDEAIWRKIRTRRCFLRDVTYKQILIPSHVGTASISLVPHVLVTRICYFKQCFNQLKWTNINKNCFHAHFFFWGCILIW